MVVGRWSRDRLSPTPRTQRHFLGSSAGLAPGVPPPQVLLPLFDFPLPVPEPPPCSPNTHTSPSELILTCLPVQEPRGRAGTPAGLGTRASGEGEAGRDRQLGVLRSGTRAQGLGQVHPAAASRLSGGWGDHLLHAEAQEDRLSRVVGADGSPDGGRGEARRTCALGGHRSVQGHSRSTQPNRGGRCQPDGPDTDARVAC